MRSGGPCRRLSRRRRRCFGRPLERRGRDLRLDPEAAIQAFVAAFNALDRTRFDSLFAEDVTLFFPSAPFPVKRIEGKTATLLWFGRLFDSLRKRGASPGVEPRDLKIQDHGDVAIATFHLGGGDTVGRRTVVLRRQRGGWAIAHLHASSEAEQR